jgi:hypothetical protein
MLQPKTASLKREATKAAMIRKEADLQAAMKSPTGLHKIAANLASPVRKYLDYIGIYRKFSVTEGWPDGMPIIYDNDIEEFTAVKIGYNGTTRIIEVEVERTELEPFEIVVKPKVPYAELYKRLYQVMKRVKERLEQGMALREDLYGFSLLESASQRVNTTITITTYLTKDALAKAFSQVERWRLRVKSILMSPFGMQGIRRWDYLTIDNVAREEIRKSGYLGSIWDADIYVNDQVTAGTFYIISEPEFTAWTPIRRDVDVIPADLPDQLLLGFVGYELLAMTVHNGKAVAKGTFDITQ